MSFFHYFVGIHISVETQLERGQVQDQFVCYIKIVLKLLYKGKPKTLR